MGAEEQKLAEAKRDEVFGGNNAGEFDYRRRDFEAEEGTT